MKIRRRKSSFRVVIYLASDVVEQRTPDRAVIPLVSLFAGTLSAWDERAAAAAAWVREVGSYRYRRLIALSAPPEVAVASIDETEVAEQLTEFSSFTGGTAFLLDNAVESWLMSVDGTTTRV